TALGGPVNSNLRQNLYKALDPVAYSDPDPSVKIWAHMALMSIMRNVEKERVDAIAKTMSDPEMTVRVQALQAIGTIGKDAKHTIPLLMKGLNDKEIAVAAWSIWALGKMGP